ncbi:hypothetical protein EXN66_Car003146 [Channa argus]|uniref:Uncharacterized protein n=1 Tax=Channa argus TaxID=215402 RepID=A0A6G1PBH1_CHAAH|nr:hypothetical protein EXN66_Car003146 [Channa argus]
MEYKNLPDAVKAPKSLSATMIPAKPGRKLYRLVGVSFGLLCILQAILNISLRLTYKLYKKISKAYVDRTVLLE